MWDILNSQFVTLLFVFLFSVKSEKDVKVKEVVVGVVTDMDLLHYVSSNETSKLNSISESNSGESTNSGNITPDNDD